MADIAYSRFLHSGRELNQKLIHVYVNSLSLCLTLMNLKFHVSSQELNVNES